MGEEVMGSRDAPNYNVSPAFREAAEDSGRGWDGVPQGQGFKQEPPTLKKQQPGEVFREPPKTIYN